MAEEYSESSEIELGVVELSLDPSQGDVREGADFSPFLGDFDLERGQNEEKKQPRHGRSNMPHIAYRLFPHINSLPWEGQKTKGDRGQ